MIYRETPAQVFSCKFWESFDNTFLTLTKHLTYTSFFDPRQNLNLIDLHHQRYSADSFFATQWANRNQFLSIFEHFLLRFSNQMNVTNFAIGKLYFAKQTKVPSNIY